MKRLTGWGFLLVVLQAYAAPVHTTYLWHLEQPIYWPAPSTYGAGYFTAWESIQQRNGGAPHPQNDVAQIFSVADRVAAYQYRPRDAIQLMAGADAGAQITYTGCLVRNVASLGAHYSYGYTPNWNAAFVQGRGLNTSGGRPRLEMVIIPYHHPLCPLVDAAVLAREIEIYQHLYPNAWGTNPARSTGFFPPELAFSERMIPTLVSKGITWTFVPSNHLSRGCANFPLVLGTGGENCNAPNPADALNPASSRWFSLTISRGCTPTDAVPFSFQPHYAQYVHPQTGAIFRLVVVPVAMAMSWQDGYQDYGVQDINTIAPYNDPARPMLIALGHDGDNAFGGGYSYYMESVPGFTAEAVAAGYEPTTVPEFLADHPVAANDLVHVEDGAWVNADGDFGDPDFINWNWPPYNSSGQTDIVNGWALDARNWAVITAATNRVLTADAVAGTVNLAAIQDPRTNPPQTIDLAWHFLLGSLNSGYMYYGSSLDMEVKPAVACNTAVSFADQLLAEGTDPVPPTIWAVQQYPHNPGAINSGPAFGYQQRPMPRDFYIWSFVYDVSGVHSVTLKYRLDYDGRNPLGSIQNETFAGGDEVSSWRSRPMTRRTFPAGNVYNDPDITFDIMPQYIAEQFYYHLSDAEVTDSGGVLLDYYLEAMDSLGQVARSDIYHTFVGSGGGTPPGRVSWSPANPHGGDSVRIYYDLAAGPLPPNTDPVFIHIGHSGWQGILNPDPAMTFDPDSQKWRYRYLIPTSATSVDFVFRDNSGNWDNNNGQDWHIPVIPQAGDTSFVMDGNLDSRARMVAQTAGITLWAGWNGSQLYLATERAQGSGNDRFLLLSSPPGNLRAAMWAKAGQVANWAAYLAEESNNGWRGWFDAAGPTHSAVGTILEGTISIVDEFGSIPARIHLCAAKYATADGGALTGQAPAAILPNGNIEADEWVGLALRPDSLTIAVLPSGVQLRWVPVLGADGYLVYRGESLGGTMDLIGQSGVNHFTDSTLTGRAFYSVRARFLEWG